jgi:hypothetical protein
LLPSICAFFVISQIFINFICHKEVAADLISCRIIIKLLSGVVYPWSDQAP